jgi:hypothetical protein
MQKKVLIACEESQAVCIEFRKLGIEAYSCDIQDCSGGHPEWHLNMDVFEAIKLYDWALMIAFPPCTHLAVSGAAWFEQKQKDGRQQEGINFFTELTKTNIPKWAIENPIGIMSNHYRKPDQIINPYYFGDPVPKKTCLWLNNLPALKHYKEDDIYGNKKTWVEPEFIIGKRDGKKYSLIHYQTITKDPTERGRIRSKTFPGIAKAMAEQWSKFI